MFYCASDALTVAFSPFFVANKIPTKSVKENVDWALRKQLIWSLYPQHAFLTLLIATTQVGLLFLKDFSHS